MDRLFGSCCSELQPQGHLQNSWRLSSCDEPKGVVGNRRVWIQKVGMIKHVKELRPELELQTLSDGEGLVRREVDAEYAGAS